MSRKKREEMNEEELRAALITDCKSVLTELEKLITKGLETAPDALLRQGDAFVIIEGAIFALETAYIESIERPKAVVADKKNYN